MDRHVVATPEVRPGVSLRLSGLRIAGLGALLLSSFWAAGCQATRSYACEADGPLRCGATGVGARRSVGSYTCEVDSPLRCGGTGVGPRRSFASYACEADAASGCGAPGPGERRSLGSYLCEVDSPLACGAGGVGPRRSFASYQCEVDSPLRCGTTGGACGCAAPACSTPLPDRPPAARPGEAWCKVLVPARYETVTEEIETVCPSVRREWVPPLMETRVIPVVVQPASTEVIRTPGATRTDPVCTELCPARTETRVTVSKDACGCGTKTCETVHVPAVNGVRTREVCVQAPGTEVVTIPAQVSAEVCEVEVRPGYWRETKLPGVKERRSHVVCVSPERWEWQRNPSYVPPAPPPPACAPTRPVSVR